MMAPSRDVSVPQKHPDDSAFGIAKAKITRGQLEAALRELVTEKDEVLVIHAALWSFGHHLDIPLPEIPKTILEIFLQIAGDRHTLIFPTFTYSAFPRTRVFDLKNTRSQTGVLGEDFLKIPGTLRSVSAMESWAVRGPKARIFAATMGKTEWGPGSTWDWLEKENACIIGLGIPIHKSASIIHMPEETLQVPYRYYKSFKGTWTDGEGTVKDWISTNYVRALPAKLHFLAAEECLFRKNQVKVPKLAEITLYSALARDIVQATTELLKTDPYVFVVNRAEILEWVKTGRAEEIARLKPDERYP